MLLVFPFRPAGRNGKTSNKKKKSTANSQYGLMTQLISTSNASDRRSSVIDLIGNTPLLRLARIAPDLPPGVELYAKAEWYNPGGSVKDRPALFMIRDGERSGRLRPGMRIADATSGNTGIAYATIGAALGYEVTLAMPDNASVAR